MRLTLRELMVVIAVIGINLAGLVSAARITPVALALDFLIIVGVVITAFVAVGEVRSYAIGFGIPVVLYGTVLLAVGKDELRTDEVGILPTSRFLQSIQEPSPSPPGAYRAAQVFGSVANASSLMWAGHLFVMIATGYVGSKFAVYVHRRSRAAQH